MAKWMAQIIDFQKKIFFSTKKTNRSRQKYSSCGQGEAFSGGQKPREGRIFACNYGRWITFVRALGQNTMPSGVL
jgi:hypothetical protein